MQAIILAAGMGRRLKEFTKNNTKCMVEVNGVTLIERMLHQLDSRGLSSIIVVTGYEGRKLEQYIVSLDIHTPIHYVENKVYDRTNNIYSLSLAKNYLMKEDTLLFESDVIFEDGVLDEIMDDSRENIVLVDKYEPWMDGTCIRLDEHGRITEFISGKDFDFNNTNGCYKTVNIYKFSRNFSKNCYVPFMEAYLKSVGWNEYYEQVLRVIALIGSIEIFAKCLSGQKWYEIDDEQDLDIASVLFSASSEDYVNRLEERYGGYWRFPKLLDFCYLVNPYYPPKKMVDEMKASFEKMLVEYPSGMRVNSMLAAKNFGVHTDNIVVGNGAAELINALMGRLRGKLGVIRPTFEEYPNRCGMGNTIDFDTTELGCQYHADDVIGFFDDKGIDCLALINPDNPSGNFLGRRETDVLIKWGKERGISLIIDESFMDFSDDEGCSLLDQDVIGQNPHLFVMKSISKSYGVPGLRLGIMVSGNREMIRLLKKDVSIWNINSFAEFYMQIFGKYEKDYAEAIQQFRKERARFVKELESLEMLRVIPTQANFAMVELNGELKAREMARQLLIRYNILIKDLSEKVKSRQYIRIAIRSKEDNDKLLEAIRELEKWSRKA